MSHPYTHSLYQGLERQKTLLNEPRRELPSLNDRHVWRIARASLKRAALWFEAQMARSGERPPASGWTRPAKWCRPQSVNRIAGWPALKPLWRVR